MRVEQTKLKRNPLPLEPGEDEDAKKPGRGRGGRGRGGRGRGGRGRGSRGGAGCGRGKVKTLRRLRSKQSVPAENDADHGGWDAVAWTSDEIMEWHKWQEERWVCDEGSAWMADAADHELEEPAEVVEPSAKKRKKRAGKPMQDGAAEDEANGGQQKETSFARRPPPKREKKYMLWMAARDAFRNKIGLFVDYPSKYED